MVADGLDHPWDVAQASDGTLLVDERPGGFTAVLPDGTVQAVQADFGDLLVAGETGLMGLAVDPGFASNRRFYTCQGVTGGGHDVDRHRLDPRPTTGAAPPRRDAGRRPPGQRSSGRHGGCRLLFARDGSLLVGTGDAAKGTQPAGPGSLGGKTLRLDRTGALADNPFRPAKAPSSTPRPPQRAGPGRRAGHAGVAVEQGTYRDDEVNLLARRGLRLQPGPRATTSASR